MNRVTTHVIPVAPTLPAVTLRAWLHLEARKEIGIEGNRDLIASPVSCPYDDAVVSSSIAMENLRACSVAALFLGVFEKF
jgi:hypothetical protein